MKKEELQEILFLVKKGNQKAQTKLINHFWEDVFSFVMKKVQNYTIADEITVAVFAKVLAKINLYDESFQFRTWVLTIAQNSIIDYWRKRAKDDILSDNNIGEIKAELVSSPEELLISKQEEQYIVNAIASMDYGYRKIIELRFFEEKSIKEIAEELNISIANTKVRIMRAKKILAELLKKNAIDE